MKRLQHYINEGILDDDFDINIEPLNMDGVHNKSLFKGFMWVLEQPNETIMYYSYLKAIVDAVDVFKENLDRNHYVKALQMVFDPLDKYVNSLRSSWTSQKALDGSIAEINQYSKPVKALLELDEQMHKGCGSSWDKIRFIEYEEDVEFRTGVAQCDQKVLDKIQQLSIKDLNIEVTDKQLIIKIV